MTTNEAPYRERRCRVCGCTDADCRECIRKTGRPCSWVDADLCSACAPESAWLVRVKRGNTSHATCRIGLQTFRASSTSDEMTAVRRVAEKVALALRAESAVVERYTIVSRSAGRGSIKLTFVIGGAK